MRGQVGSWMSRSSPRLVSASLPDSSRVPSLPDSLISPATVTRSASVTTLITSGQRQVPAVQWQIPSGQRQCSSVRFSSPDVKDGQPLSSGRSLVSSASSGNVQVLLSRRHQPINHRHGGSSVGVPTRTTYESRPRYQNPATRYQSSSPPHPATRYQSSSPPPGGTLKVVNRATTFYADPPALPEVVVDLAYPRPTTYYETPPLQPLRQPLATHYEEPPSNPVYILRTPSPTTYGEPPELSEVEKEPATKTTYGYPPTPRSAPRVAVSGESTINAMPQTEVATKPHQSSDKISVECQAVFVNKPVRWTFQVPSGMPVKEAVAKAEEEAMQRSGTLFQDGRKCVTVLPSVSREAMVGEWSHRNMDQPPLLIFSGGEKESDSHGGQHMLEDQLVMMSVVQKQLNEQCAIIQNQESFIAELQNRSRQNWQQLEEALRSIEGDVADIKGRIHTLQDVDTPVGKSFSEKKDPRRRRQK